MTDDYDRAISQREAGQAAQFLAEACRRKDVLNAELLATLKDVFEYLDMTLGPCEDGCDCLLHVVQAAIAKAEA
jgi:hypothetical protein